MSQNICKTIKSLENASLAKINQASHALLLNAVNNVDPESLNFDVMDGDDQLFYCIWANLSHNPRIKDFTFSKKQLSFTLPRPLTLAHVAVRSVFMSFDMYSSRSRTFACRVKKEKYDFGKYSLIEKKKTLKEKLLLILCFFQIFEDPIPDIKPPQGEQKALTKQESADSDDLPDDLKGLLEMSKSLKKVCDNKNVLIKC